MKYLNLEKISYFYTLKEPVPTTPDMWNLFLFLTSDYGSGWTTFKDWLNTPEYIEIGGNTTHLEKKDDTIRILDLFDFDKNEDEAYKNAFIISKDEFLKLLEKWEALYKLFPNEIMITYDNDKLTIEGID